MVAHTHILFSSQPIGSGSDSLVYPSDKVVAKLYSKALAEHPESRMSPSSVRDRITLALGQYRTDTQQIAEAVKGDPISETVKIRNEDYAATLNVLEQGTIIGLHENIPYNLGQRLIEGLSLLDDEVESAPFKPILEKLNKRIQSIIPDRLFVLDLQNIKAVFDHHRKTIDLFVTDLAAVISETYRNILYPTR